MDPKNADSSNPANPTDSLKSIGKGIASFLSGLSKAGNAPAAIVPNAERTFVLRYNSESKTVREGDLPAGSTLPTVDAAFTQHANTLGLESGRERTYRVGETVADGAAQVEWGNTYTAAVTRSVKG